MENMNRELKGSFSLHPLSSNERRQMPRFQLQAKVTTKISEINLDNAMEYDHDIECLAVDASQKGIRFSSHVALPSGAVIDVKVKHLNKDEDYQLTGEVRWVSGSKDKDVYLIGMQLFDWLETDITSWKEQFISA